MAENSDLPRLGPTIPTVTHVLTGTYTGNLVTGNRSTGVTAQFRSEARIGRTREDDLVLKYVL